MKRGSVGREECTEAKGKEREERAEDEGELGYSWGGEGGDPLLQPFAINLASCPQLRSYDGHIY